MKGDLSSNGHIFTTVGLRLVQLTSDMWVLMEFSLKLATQVLSFAASAQIIDTPTWALCNSWLWQLCCPEKPPSKPKKSVCHWRCVWLSATLSLFLLKIGERKSAMGTIGFHSMSTVGLGGPSLQDQTSPHSCQLLKSHSSVSHAIDSMPCQGMWDVPNLLLRTN